LTTNNFGPNTVVRAFDDAVSRVPDALFLDFAGESFTYGQFHTEVTRVAHGLAELGVSRGDTVTTMLDNNPDGVIAWLAINRLGAISVPLNTALKGEFLRHQIADSSARLLIAESDYADRVIAIEDGLADGVTLLHRGQPPQRASRRLQVRSLEDHRTDDTSPIAVDVSPNDLAALIYTAGTTGPSKGCMISHNYMCNLARQVIDGAQRQPDELHWNPLPLFHLNATASTVVASMLLGAPASIAGRFSLSGFWPEIKRTDARVATVLGAMLSLIGQMDDTPEMKDCYGQLRVVRGSPFPAELQQIWRDRFGVSVAGSQSYGLTEASLVVSTPPGAAAPPGSSGRRNDDFDVQIVDDQDGLLDDGATGEVVVRPRRPNIMFDGYWRRPEETLATLRNVWFHTGDLGRFDADGWFFFADRKKDYLRRRGENISSQELENTLLQHPDISEVAVHAVPSEFTEDDVKLTVVLETTATLTEADLCRWTLDRLPYFAVPRYIEFRAQLPKNAFGRTQKYLLREQGITAQTWDRENSDIEVVKR
jgi:carnitine-CoA ligase